MFRLCLLPQGEVGLIALLANTSQFAALILDVLQRTTREDAVMVLLVICLDVEIDRTI